MWQHSSSALSPAGWRRFSMRPRAVKKPVNRYANNVGEEMEQAGEFVERTTAKAKDAVSRGVKQVRHGVSQAREFVNNEIAGVRAELCDCENKEE